MITVFMQALAFPFRSLRSNFVSPLSIAIAGERLVINSSKNGNKNDLQAVGPWSMALKMVNQAGAPCCHSTHFRARDLYNKPLIRFKATQDGSLTHYHVKSSPMNAGAGGPACNNVNPTISLLDATPAINQKGPISCRIRRYLAMHCAPRKFEPAQTMMYFPLASPTQSAPRFTTVPHVRAGFCRKSRKGAPVSQYSGRPHGCRAAELEADRPSTQCLH